MTTVSTGPSSSPQWDNRNRGFIPPAQLQQLKQNSPTTRPELHEFPQRHQPHSPNMPSTLNPASAGGSPQPRPQLASNSSGQSRSSFFSFRRTSIHEPQPPQSSPRMPANVDATKGSTPPTQTHVRGPSQQTINPPPPNQQSQSHTRRPSLGGGTTPPPPLHPEIRSVVQLTLAHAHKIYFSGPLVRRVERQPDGQRPAKDDGWTDVWGQLGGTTLSIWDMKQIEEANKAGTEVPPTYVNVTDAFVQVLGSVTVPGTHNNPPKRYTNVLTLNTAGSNLLLFSCPSTAALMSWAAALRLSAWEKSRLEEIYTAHLIRISLPEGGREIRSTLVRGRMEGWVRIRLAGQTDWKRMWMIISSGGGHGDNASVGSGSTRPTSPGAPRKNRMSMTNFFSRDNSPPHAPAKPSLSLFVSPKPKDRKRAFLTMHDVTQAFAVYPERPELISRSTLMKLEGWMGDEEGAGGMRNREGWMLVMPELEGGNTQATEMLKWVVAFHDAFELYGRPRGYTWDPRDPVSMMFAYPVGPHKDLLFLDREQAETMDPRDDRTSAVRSRLLSVLLERVRGITDPASRPISSVGPPTLPPLPNQTDAPGNGDGALPQLPPLSFDATPTKTPQDKRALTPITEKSVGLHGTRSMSGGTEGEQGSPVKPGLTGGPSTVVEEASSVLGGPVSATPPPAPVDGGDGSKSVNSGRRSEDSTSLAGGSRPDSKFSPSFNANISKTPAEDSAPPDLTAERPQSAASRKRGSLDQLSSTAPDTAPLEPPSSVRMVSPPRSVSPFSIMTSPHSLLTSPHSPLESPKHRPLAESFGPSFEQLPLTSPNSPATSKASSTPALPTKQQLPPQPSGRPSVEETHNLFDEAGALYYMQQEKDRTNKAVPPRRMPTTITEGSDSSSEYDSSPASPRSRPNVEGISKTSGQSPTSPDSRRGTSMGFERIANVIAADSTTASSDRGPGSPPIGSLGHKPSGARALPGNRKPATAPRSISPRSRDSDADDSVSDPAPTQLQQSASMTQASIEDPNADALAALSFLENEASPTKTTSAGPPIPRSQLAEPSGRTSSPQGSSENTSQYRSSFAPSKQAAERKARSQAQQAAHHAAVHRPGRSKSKRKSNAVERGGWHESSEEEEEEEEDDEEDDEDEDVDSDAEPSARASRVGHAPPVSQMAPVRPLHVQPRGSSPAVPTMEINAPQPRPPRHLPQIPRGRSPGEPEEYPAAPQRRMMSEQYSEAGRRTYHDDGPHLRPQSEFPQPGAARQTVWSQVLEPGRAPGAIPDVHSNNRDTFVQIEPPSQTMTKAFTPQGLLSAGMQDKQDRSAKRQEELARESGASLINVPNKPPPPQTGLLGAITAHERERKREGGVGAALTEREREKRLAEERQRKLDDYQRQQLDQMAQGGSMYGGQQFPGFNPMMGNPMMMGMNPMMTGMNPMMTGLNPMMTGMGGYPGMSPGFGPNPQHMFAAQQAAQAYQQAMMAFSVAGSQAGDGVGGGGGGPAAQLNPMMTGNSMAFDPRFSMMGMPMMTSPMGTPMGAPMGAPMGGQMGGSMGSPMGSPMGMGMQMGGNGFDQRYSPSMMDNGLRPQGDVGQSPAHGGSPNRGSPAPEPPRTENSPKP